MKKILFLLFFILILCASVSAYDINYYHSDNLGSPVVVTDSSGDVKWSADYKSFGAAKNEVGVGDLKYNSKELDDSGLYYYGARYYDSSVGRFITADSWAGKLIDSQSQNRYIYAKNNPLKYVDPTGNQFFDSAKTREHIKLYVDKYWGSLIKKDLGEIRSVASQTGVPGEAILSAILVEDIRFYYIPDAPFSWANIKSKIRKMLPNWLLNIVGHNPNVMMSGSNYGDIHGFAVGGSCAYLNSLDNLDSGTASILRKAKVKARWGSDGDIYYVSGLSKIERVAIALKGHSEHWKRSGYDIFSYDFKTVSSFGERVGILETLNNIAYYQGNTWVKNFEPFMDKIIPHANPGLGGTNLGWSNYGTIAKEFVDSGMATKLLNSK